MNDLADGLKEKDFALALSLDFGLAFSVSPSSFFASSTLGFSSGLVSALSFSSFSSFLPSDAVVFASLVDLSSAVAASSSALSALEGDALGLLGSVFFNHRGPSHLLWSSSRCTLCIFACFVSNIASFFSCAGILSTFGISRSCISRPRFQD